MERDVVKCDLEFDKTFSYFIDHIDCGKTLSGKVVKEIDFSKGKFFTFLSPNAKNERMYDFSHGGIMPTVSVGHKFRFAEGEDFYPRQVITTDEPCSEFIENYTQKTIGNLAILENFMLNSHNVGNKFEDFGIKIYEDEVYFVLQKQHSLEDIYKSIRMCNLSWHFFVVLTSCKKKLKSDLNASDLQEICDNLKFIIAGSYDSEGYIFWEKIVDSL
ncbi:MAG: hypothetical protein V4494_05855 [Chlamydiota bacterium]